MTRTPDLASILKGLPRARHLLAPLREVREKEYGAPLPPAVFPVSAFATESLPREDAWKLFRELRGDPRLANVAVTVTTPESEVLASFWEDACPAAERLLSLRTSVGEPESTAASNSALAWVKSTAGVSSLETAAPTSSPRVHVK